jgi:hypothetical protein
MARPAQAQQYNSDSYLSKPHGMATIIMTAGDRNFMWMITASLLPRWEFTTAAYVYDNDDDLKTDDGYSTSYYAKYMFYENKAKTAASRSRRERVWIPVSSRRRLVRTTRSRRTG